MDYQPLNDEHQSGEPKKTKRVKKIRCEICRKKITMMFIECKCGKILCMKHRYVELHNCQYDYKAEWNEKFRKNNPIIKNPKFELI